MLNIIIFIVINKTMVTLIKTIRKNIITHEEVELTQEQANLYSKNETEFFDKYGESLVWVKAGDSIEESEWINIFTKGKTPYWLNLSLLLNQSILTNFLYILYGWYMIPIKNPYIAIKDSITGSSGIQPP